MNKNILTILGCSSSLALALLNTNSANANPSNSDYKEYVFKAPQPNQIQVDRQQEDNLSSYSSDELEDKEGEIAIDRYGCDCSGCRNLVRNINQKELFFQ
jgi:hypothetical protein